MLLSILFILTAEVKSKRAAALTLPSNQPPYLLFQDKVFYKYIASKKNESRPLTSVRAWQQPEKPAAGLPVKALQMNCYLHPIQENFISTYSMMMFYFGKNAACHSLCPMLTD